MIMVALLRHKDSLKRKFRTYHYKAGDSGAKESSTQDRTEQTWGQPGLPSEFKSSLSTQYSFPHLRGFGFCFVSLFGWDRISLVQSRWSSCFSLLNAGITVVCNYTLPLEYIFLLLLLFFYTWFLWGRWPSWNSLCRSPASASKELGPRCAPPHTALLYIF